MCARYVTLEAIGQPRYRVGDDGSFWKLIGGGVKKKPLRWKRLSGMTLVDGHIQVAFGKGTKKRYLHHLVLAAFGFPRPDGLECRHLNGNPSDNHLTNLLWGTRKQNIADRYLHDEIRHGSRSHLSKWTESEISELRTRAKNGETNSRLATAFGMSQRNVRDIINRRTWKHIP